MKNLLVLFLLLSWIPMISQTPPTEPEKQEMPVYEMSTFDTYVALEMGYAKSSFKNPEIKKTWDEKRVYQIELVFTRYPYKLDKWLTAYDQLLKARLKALYALDSTLFSDERITWKYVMQTDGKTEAEAKKMFHGFIIHTKKPDDKLSDIEAITFRNKEIEDSTAYNVLERHKEWKNKLIVLDWTGSMYRYGASVLLWHRLNLETKSVKHFVFFNDGNERKSSAKRIGKTGGIYHTPADRIDSVLLKMQLVMERGNGGDADENDVEALLKSTLRLKDFEEVILIADNRSSVRDLILSKELKHPIKVILCGVDAAHPIHEDYLTLARISGGSVHTIEKDISHLRKVTEGKVISIDGYKYALKKGKFIKM